MKSRSPKNKNFLSWYLHKRRYIRKLLVTKLLTFSVENSSKCLLLCKRWQNLHLWVNYPFELLHEVVESSQNWIQGKNAAGLTNKTFCFVMSSKNKPFIWLHRVYEMHTVWVYEKVCFWIVKSNWLQSFFKSLRWLYLFYFFAVIE